MLRCVGKVTREICFACSPIRVQFYRNPTRDPCSAKLNKELYEGEHELPANEMLDEKVKELERLRETELAKAISNSPASNGVKNTSGGRISE